MDVRPTVTLQVEETFDPHTASTLRARLVALGHAGVVLDFSRVRTFRDSAIDVLTRGLTTPTLQLRGLDNHQERLFRYLGIGAVPAPRRSVELDA
jgi:anti-anti-sigma regulatory factor